MKFKKGDVVRSRTTKEIGEITDIQESGAMNIEVEWLGNKGTTTMQYKEDLDLLDDVPKHETHHITQGLGRELTEYRNWHRDHYNFMTPELLSCALCILPKVVVELTWSEDFQHKPMYGVAFVEKVGRGKYKAGCEASKYNKLFQGKDAFEEATEYFYHKDDMLRKVEGGGR